MFRALRSMGSGKANGDAGNGDAATRPAPGVDAAIDSAAPAVGAVAPPREPARRERGQITLRRSNSQACSVGSPVWVPERGLDQALGKQRVLRWVKGVVEAASRDGAGSTLLRVRTEEGAVREHRADELPLQNERDDTVDDLVKSDFLHEPGILHTLRVRYALDMIYTYSGSILIAANPHKRLRQLYGPRMMLQYRGVPLGELSPHVYAIAEQAFSAMMIDEQRQAILVSGESGAGKTESAKMVMQYLAARGAAPHGPAQHRPAAKGAAMAPIEEQVLESNPLLEAFGNAKTVRNDNSSRFGKFTDMFFDGGGRVSGAAISTYLLERSRVVSTNSPERSYHIFYQLCAGANPEQRAAYGLEGGPAAFHYLSQSTTLTLPGVDDAEGLRGTLDAMAIVGMSELEQADVLQTVAAVLHLGNVHFTADEREGCAPSDAGAASALARAARLLGVLAEDLQHALTTRAIEVGGESITKRLDAAAATESRDSLAKNLYARLFDWLVAAINRRISALGAGHAGGRAHAIGILDIYGFESFKENSFEQLCINLANERLQQQFNQQVFKGEQEEYAREGIDWSYVEFVDNQDCLDLLEGGAANPALAVFPLIDEACRLPRATFQDLAHTLRTRLAEQPRFVAPKRPQHAFGVEHYAGRVTYAATHLLAKNKDFVVAEHSSLLRQSGSAFLRELFGGEEPADAGGAKRGGKSAFKLVSVGAQFRKQLQGLISALSQCQPHYIRCIKPNPESRPGSLTPPYVLEQLRAGGVLEAVRIASAGFPTRKAFRPFAQRYALLLAAGRGGYQPIDAGSLSDEEAAGVCRRVLQATKAQGWQIGKTRVFLRAGQLALLEGARVRRLTRAAITIQSFYRGLASRRQLRAARAAATRIQATWRGRQARGRVGELRRERAATRIQAAWRGHATRRHFIVARRERAATRIQAVVRGRQQRARFRRQTELGKRQALRAEAERRATTAAVVLQSHARRRIARKKAAALRAEKARWAALEAGNAALEQEVAAWKARYQLEAARADELAADCARLQAELLAARLEVQNAVEAGDAKAARAQRRDAAAPAAAAAAASAALVAELERVRVQKAAAEEQGRRGEQLVSDLRGQQELAQQEAAQLGAALQEKQRENAKLWEQMRSAAEEYHREFVAKENSIRQLQADGAAARQGMQAEVDRLRAAMEAEKVELEQALQLRADRALAEADAEARELGDARQKNVHFSARVIALNSRLQSLQRQLRESAAREAALQADLEAARRAAAGPGADRGGAPLLSRGASLGADAPPSTAPNARDYAGGAAALSEPQEQAISLLSAATMSRKLPVLNIQYGATPHESIGVPVASWIASECLLCWAGRWGPQEADAAGYRLRDALLEGCQGEALAHQCYWLSTAIAMGGMLRVRSLGRQQCSGLFLLGDELIDLGPLHAMLALSVADALPVSPGALFSADAHRMARSASLRSGGASGYESLMNSPWKGLLGGLSNVLETLRAEGVPPPACRALVWAALRYLDAELLNALMLRRDCCSVAAVKALQAGLQDLRAWAAYCGPLWVGEAQEMDTALEHVEQAAAYLLAGKDECVRRVLKGQDILPELRRLCPSLTLPQLHRLTEHHHDDWLVTGEQSADTIRLLDSLKHIDGLSEHWQPSPRAGDGQLGQALPSASDLHSFDEEETMLLDSQAAFVLPKRLLMEAAKHFVKAPTSQHMAPGTSLLDRIDLACRSNIQLPRQLRDRQEFAFLR